MENLFNYEQYAFYAIRQKKIIGISAFVLTLVL